MKEIFIKILFIVMTTNIIASNSSIISSDCTYYSEKMMYHVKKVKRITLERPTNWCNLADELELTVNYVDSTKKVCPYNKDINSALKTYMFMLMQATIKCGH